MRAIDLFAGAGGFSTGAAMAGCEVVWAANHRPAAMLGNAVYPPPPATPTPQAREPAPAAPPPELPAEAIMRRDDYRLVPLQWGLHVPALRARPRHHGLVGRCVAARTSSSCTLRRRRQGGAPRHPLYLPKDLRHVPIEELG